MKSKHFIIYIAVFILLSINVLGAQPVIAVPQTAPTQNLVLVYPKLTEYKAGVPLDFHMHVYNASGFLLNNGTNGIKYCTMHLYNSTNNHIFKQNLTYDGIEMTWMFNDMSFVKEGQYGYIVWCEMRNAASGAGFASGNVVFSREGVTLIASELFLPLVLIMLFVIGFYTIIALNWEFNLTGKEKINVMKLGLVWLLVWVVPLLAQIALIFAASYNSTNDTTILLTTFYSVTVWIAILLSAYFGIYVLYNTLLYFSNVGNKK